MEDKNRIVYLVKQAKNGDSHSFAQLYEMYYKDLYRTALYRLGNVQDAENAVSDAVVDAYVGIKNLKVEEAFRPWLFKILHNKINKQISEYVKNREHMESDTVEDMAERPESGNREVDTAIDKSLIEQAFQALNDKDRQVVTCMIYGEMNSREIAETLHMNQNTVRSIYNRALDKMKRVLEKGEVL